VNYSASGKVEDRPVSPAHPVAPVNFLAVKEKSLVHKSYICDAGSGDEQAGSRAISNCTSQIGLINPVRC